MTLWFPFPEYTDLECYRGDTWQADFTTSLLADDVDKAYWRIRKRPDGDLLLALDSATDPDSVIVVDDLITINLQTAKTTGLPAGWWYYDLSVLETVPKTATLYAGRFHLIADIAADSEAPE